MSLYVEECHFFRSHWFNILVLVFAGGLLYGAGLFSIPPIDRDEARFAQATRQMVEDGDYLHIRFQDEARNKKPPGIYHVQAVVVCAARWLSGDGEMVGAIGWYRVPSVLGALAAVVLVYGLGVYFFEMKSIAFVAAGLLASSVLMVVEAHQATTDAFLCAVMTGVMGLTSILYLRRGNGAERSGRGGGNGGGVIDWVVVLLWCLLAVGFYVKGPIAVLIPLVGVVSLCIWDREVQLIRRLRLVSGLIIFTVLTACWAVPLHLATGGAFWVDAFMGDFLPKLGSGVESHSFWPGFYAVMVVVTFWPGSLVAGLGLARAWSLMRGENGDEREVRVVRFLFAWLVPMWVILEMVPTRLPHYVLPLYPVLALLIAYGIGSVVLEVAGDVDGGEAGGDGGGDGERGVRIGFEARLGFLFWGLLTLLMGCGVVYSLGYLQWDFSWVIIIPVLGLASAAVFSVRSAWRGRFTSACVVGMWCSVVVWGSLCWLILPGVDALWVSRTVARELGDLDGGGGAGGEVLVVGYREPALVFLTDRDIRFVTAKRAAEMCIEQSGIIVVITKKRESVFLTALQAGGYRAMERIGVVKGYQYSNGKWVSLIVMRGFAVDVREARGGDE